MDGVLIINKPKGYTSHDVVNIIRKQLNISKVGHTGTLDPNATGVLPILVGKATKISKYLIEHNKIYIAELRLGEKSKTGDTEGEIIERKRVPELKQQQLEETLKSFLGKQKQVPPIYSSIKINGKKAYEYARNGEQVEIKPRDIEIMNITLINYESNVITFEVECSKGTYIRTLCEDIAKKLGTVGLMQNLTRTRVDIFDISNSYSLEDLKEEKKILLISIEDVFKDEPKIKLIDSNIAKFLNGVKLSINKQDGIYCIYSGKIFIGLGIVENNFLKRDIVTI